MPTRSTRPASTSRRRPRLRLSVQLAPRAGECPVDRAQLRRWTLAALERDADLTLRFVGRLEGRRLNAQFRARDYATNVLTFAYPQTSPQHGAAAIVADVVVCLPVLAQEARAQRKRLRDHLAHLVVHGVLHAQGMDHLTPEDAQRMEQRETQILARFRIADPYR